MGKIIEQLQKNAKNGILISNALFITMGTNTNYNITILIQLTGYNK